MKYITLFLIACSPVISQQKPVVSPDDYIQEETMDYVFVFEMDSTCESMPRFCLEQCQLGNKSMCIPQEEKMIIVYR